MRSLLFALSIVVFSLSCSHPPKADSAGASNLRKPVAIIVEKEISGTVLGLRLLAPLGLAVDNTGTMYLVDSGNDRLIRFNDDLEPTKDIGGHGSQPGLFDQPTYVTVDNDLNLYIADVGNRRVCRHNRRLEYVDEIKLESEDEPFLLSRPTGLAVSDYGELWMCDEENSRIATFNNIGQFDRFIGGYGYSGGSLRSPQKLTRLNRGDFVVCDAGNRRLVYYDQYGNFDREIKTPELDFPSSLVKDSDGRLWVLDRQLSALDCLSPKGTQLYLISERLPGSDLDLNAPTDLALPRDGRLLISDTGNNRVLVCKIVNEEL